MATLANQILNENTSLSNCYEFKNLYQAKEIIASFDEKSQTTAKFFAKAVFDEYGYTPNIRSVKYNLCDDCEPDLYECLSKEQFVPGAVMICSAQLAGQLYNTVNSHKRPCPSPDKLCTVESFWQDCIAENITVPFYTSTHAEKCDVQIDPFFDWGTKQLKEVDEIVLCLSEFDSAEYGVHLYHKHSSIYGWHPEIIICNDLKGKVPQKQIRFINNKMDKFLRKLSVSQDDIRWSELNPQQLSVDLEKLSAIMVLSPRKSYYPSMISNQNFSFYMMPENYEAIMLEMTNLKLFHYFQDVNILAGQLKTQESNDFKILYEMWNLEGLSKADIWWGNLMNKLGIWASAPIIILDVKRALKASYSQI